MESHINEIENFSEQLTELGEIIAEKLIIALLLSRLKMSYRTLITVLEARPKSDLSLSLIKNKRIEEYNRRRKKY